MAGEVRLGADNGHRSDMAPCPKGAQGRTNAAPKGLSQTATEAGNVDTPDAFRPIAAPVSVRTDYGHIYRSETSPI
jgi:hypothetical protein